MQSLGWSLCVNNPLISALSPSYSSTHSLQNEDSDASATASPSPSSSLGSPCSPSSAIVSHPRAAFGQSPTQPRAGSSPTAGISLAQKGQASSCPPSILTSATDIPVLLVNGCLEQGDGPPRLAKAPPSSATQPPVPGCSAASRLGGMNNALSAPALSCLSDSESQGRAGRSCRPQKMLGKGEQTPFSLCFSCGL